MNHQFKIGDKVRVKQNAREMCESQGWFHWDEDMDKIQGEETVVFCLWDDEIDEVDIDHAGSTITWTIPTYVLELIEPGKDA